jgi:hypothetical protein
VWPAFLADDHPKCLQLFSAPVEDFVRTKREWEEALKRITRYGNPTFAKGSLTKDAPLPFIPHSTKHGSTVWQETLAINKRTKNFFEPST